MDGLALVFQVVGLHAAGGGTRAGGVRELDGQGEVAGLDRVFEGELRVVHLPVQTVREPVSQDAREVDALRLADPAADPQAEARLLRGDPSQLVQRLISRQRARVREVPGVRERGTRRGRRRGLGPHDVCEAESDVNRVADRQRGVRVRERAVAVRIIYIDTANLAVCLRRLGQCTQERREDGGKCADLFLHVHS